MTPSRNIARRRLLRATLGGGAMVTVGLPLLNCFLNGNGDALASGEPLPVVFGTWFQGLGFAAPGVWEPKKLGADYEMRPLLGALQPFKHKINIYSGMRAFADGKPVDPHDSGPKAVFQGEIPRAGERELPSIDSLIADHIGRGTRFRSIEVACHGVASEKSSMSRKGGSVVNPAEVSPVALYARLFGSGFQDPNASDFKPDPVSLLRKSALSYVQEQRKEFLKDVGASDKARLDEYFTSVRELENQLEIQTQKPAPMQACSVPKKIADTPLGPEVSEALTNHALFAKLIANAVACGQTRVFNILLSESNSNLRKPGTQRTFHMATHEETLDPNLGYQPLVGWFTEQVVNGFRTLLETLNGIREGNGSLLDRTLVLYGTETGFAKIHTLENIPLITAGSAGGRMKTGLHVAALGDPVTRLGLTIQNAFGMPVNEWGTDSHRTSKLIGEVLA